MNDRSSLERTMKRKWRFSSTRDILLHNAVSHQPPPLSFFPIFSRHNPFIDQYPSCSCIPVASSFLLYILWSSRHTSCQQSLSYHLVIDQTIPFYSKQPSQSTNLLPGLFLAFRLCLLPPILYFQKEGPQSSGPI